MKKVLSLALALVMMFVVCVPAFAVDLNSALLALFPKIKQVQAVEFNGAG